MKTKKATYAGYTGKKQWKVTHPNYKDSATVTAPDSTSAVVAAAQARGTDWTAYSFYAYAVATPI